jgi:bacterioferritin-associated ferredoxin
MSSERVVELIRAHALEDVDAVARDLGVGGGCGSCRPDIEEILAELRGEPLPEPVRRANQKRCEAETLRKVDTALFVGIAGQLPPQTRLELVSVEGLRVSLHVSSGDTPELRARVADRLRKIVCADLDVVFG